MILFINYKIQLSIYLVHFPLLVLKIMVLRFLKYLFHTGFTQEFDQRLVFRQSTMGTQQRKAAFFCIPFGDLLLGLVQRCVEIIFLNIHQTLNPRSEEHTSELQSLMRISYAVFCLKKKQKNTSQKIIRIE